MLDFVGCLPSYTAAVAGLRLRSALAALLIYLAYAKGASTCPNPTPTAVARYAVPIMVASTTAGQMGLVLLGHTKASGIMFPSTFYRAAAQEYR